MLLSRKQYAKRRGVSDTAVIKAIKSGRITLTNNMIDPDKADKEWTENTNPAQAQTPDTSTDNGTQQSSAPVTQDALGISYKASRASKEGYEALLKKLEYEEKSRKLIPIVQAETDAFTAARISRDKYLTLVDRAAPLLIGVTDMHEWKKILKKQVNECLIDLTDFLHGNKHG